MIESSAFELMEDLAMLGHTKLLIQKQATAQFASPTDAQAAKLATIDNLDRLDRLPTGTRD